MRAVQIAETGGPDRLIQVDLPLPEPGRGEVRVRHRAIGLNYIDVYQRTGTYPVPLPATLGLEAAGVVEAVGDGVEALHRGDRVAYAGVRGGYAQANVVAADRLAPIPDDISFETAAAVMLKGMTAEFLCRRLWPVGRGDWVLVHAAAGGVGSLLVQWLSRLGVRVIGTAGAPGKLEAAKASGCEVVISSGDPTLADQVRRLTGGAGVKVAYDSVGAATLDISLAALAKRGLFASYGAASGPAPPVAPARLAAAGSLFMTRPTLFDYIAQTDELQASAAALFEVLASGAVKARIGQSWALSDIRKAHQALEARETTGASVILPD